MCLCIIGAPQSAIHANNRFERTIETIRRKFDHVLQNICKLSADIIKATDLEFNMVYPRVQGHRFHPFFNNFIVPIDGTHMLVVVPV